MRIATVKIEGKLYPLVFSLNAAEKIEDECIPVSKMMDCFMEPEKYAKNSIRLVKDLVYIMISEGIRYCVRKEITKQNKELLELELPEKDALYQDMSYEDNDTLIQALYDTLITSKKKE